MPWATFEKNGYLESFPDQMGSVHTFRGDEKDHAELLRRTEAHEDRGPLLESTDIVLCPAACHALYPTQSGVLPEGGRRFEIYGYCFRHEPSTDPFRMQSFRMHEFVYLGTPDGARAHRDEWIDRGLDVLTGLGLEVESVVANDPFFGRPGRMLAANQRAEELKYELVAPVFAARRPDRHLVVELPHRPLLAPVRHHHGRRRAGPHRLLRIRGGPHHPDPARPVRHRSRCLARRASGPCCGPRRSAADDVGTDGGLPALDVDAVRAPPAARHRADWTETNCYVDVWIEVLHALGLDPVAAAAFTLSCDFEGDQWTFFKYPPEDLRTLFGIEVAELNVWRPVVDHVEEQLGLGTAVHRRGRRLVPAGHPGRLLPRRTT